MITRKSFENSLNRFANQSFRFWRNILLFLALLLALIGSMTIVWLAYAKAYGLVHPLPQQAYTTPDQIGIATWEDVELYTQDGLTLYAWYVAPKPEAKGAVVILVPGFGNNRSGLINDGLMLYEASGIGFITLDLRNQGVSEGDVTTLGVREVLDVHAAVAFLLSRDEIDRDRIGILGHSMGASTALMAMGRNLEIDAIVSISAFSSLEETVGESFKTMTGLPAFPFAPLTVYFGEQLAGYQLSEASPIDWLDEIAPRPILFMHGTDDPLLPVSNTERLYAAASEPKFIYLFQGATHADLRETAPEQYQEIIVGFFERYLLGEKE